MKTRIISGLALLTTGIYVIVNGGLPYWLFMTISSLMVHFELQKMISDRFLRLRTAVGGLFVLMAFLTTQSSIGTDLWMTMPMICLSLGVVSMAILELIAKKLFFQSHLILASIRATTLSVATMPFLCLIRTEALGFAPMFFVCVIIWSSDVMAYFGGRFLGKTQLSKLSPNKTVEGSIFGLIGGLIAASIFVHYNPLAIPYFWAAVVGVVVLGQMGDLHESLSKRFYNVKDSSNLIPGHGGFYDRMDSFILALPAFYFWIHVF